MTFVNLLSNPSGRRTQVGYSVFGGTLGQDTNADSYARAAGAVNPSNLGIIIEAMTIGDKLAANTTYTFSGTIYGSATNVRLRVAGTGVTTADSPDVLAATGFNRVSATFTTGASGTVSFYVLNTTAAVATNVVAFRDAQVELGSIMNAYVDGTSSNYTWAGPADGSMTWGPVVTVVANPTFTPPRNEVTLSIPPGDVMNSVSLNRFVGSVPTLVRSQPATGFDTRVVYDYEPPYDQPCAYQLRVTFTDPSALSTIWDEVWSSLSAWSGDTPSWSVASGVASAGSGSLGVSSITRAVSPAGKYRIQVGSLKITGINSSSAAGSGIFLMSGATIIAQIAPVIGGQLQVIRGASVQGTSISGTSPFTIDMLGSTIVLSGSGGSYSFVTSASVNSIQLTADSPGVTSIGRVTVSAYAQAFTSTETSTVVTLSPAAPWLIHPSNPSMSVPLSSPARDRTNITVRDVGEITNGSATTEHQILGQSLPITTVSGPRLGNKLTVILGCRTAAHEQALSGILQDGTPLLLRAPASYRIGWDEGFYSVGDVTRGRISQRLGDPMRDFTLPLTQVQSPVVAVQNAGWSWAALAAAFPTWSAVAAAFNTWADVLTNNRKPGF